MARTLMFAWATPASPEALAAFHHWYDEIHIPQLRAALPALISARRFRLTAVGVPTPAAPAGERYLCVYELDDIDAPTAAATLRAARREGRIDPTDTLDVTGNPPAVEWYQEL